VQIAATQFRSAGLPFPPIPQTLRGHLREHSEWHFSTLEASRSAYALLSFVMETEDNPVDNYILISHDGHGVNSWAIHYYLVYGPLALFVQTAWGGIYTDNDAAAQRMERRFRQATALIDAVERAKEEQLFGLPQRLIVVVSDFYDSRWRISGPDGMEWQDTSMALEDALNWAQAL